MINYDFFAVVVKDGWDRVLGKSIGSKPEIVFV